MTIPYLECVFISERDKVIGYFFKNFKDELGHYGIIFLA